MSSLRSRFQLRKRILDTLEEKNYGEEAGLMGEENARINLEKKLGPQGWKFLSGVLIPDPNRIVGRFEIDIIAISPKGIVLIEVKHWKGKIDVSDEGMKQTKGGVDYPFRRLDDRIIKSNGFYVQALSKMKWEKMFPPLKQQLS